MPETIFQARWQSEFERFSERLGKIYRAMDQAYQAVAEHYAFHCDGCTDNCCRSLFHHHTYLEYLFLKQGVDALAEICRTAVRERVERVVDKWRTASETEQGLYRLCPLNVDGRCVLYDHRPMICRLHGIPHELHLPGGKVLTGPGCDLFGRACSGNGDLRLDRTPIYTELAELEKCFKQAADLHDRPKMTVAQMIVSFT